MNPTVKQGIDIEGKVFEVEIIGEYDPGDSHCGFDNGGWCVIDWLLVDSKKYKVEDFGMVEKVVFSTDWSDEFAKELRDQKEAALEYKFNKE